jgi:hypothetical protein
MLSFSGENVPIRPQFRGPQISTLLLKIASQRKRKDLVDVEKKTSPSLDAVLDVVVQADPVPDAILDVAVQADSVLNVVLDDAVQSDPILDAVLDIAVQADPVLMLWCKLKLNQQL